MIARGSLWLPLLVLLLLAALSFWIERSVQMTASGNTTGETDPEGIMENFDALRTDQTGRPQYRLSAKKLKHYTGNGISHSRRSPAINLTRQPIRPHWVPGLN